MAKVAATDAPDTFPMTIEAAKTNNMEFLRWCLHKGQNPDETDHVYHILY
jgi:hypothetical protein